MATTTTHSATELTERQGRYRTLVALGEGGTAKVYLAVRGGPSGFNKLVVLKLLKENLADDREFREMFLNEARLAARLNHQNIVQTYEVYERDGVPIIVMEYLEGQSLSVILNRARDSQKLPLPMLLRIICEVLSGLHHSHELTDYDGKPFDVVHRDMTPHNIFVSYAGQVKILDFGIAKLNGSMAETETGVVKGKIRYMPKEQLEGSHVDRRTDLFAVGVMLWEAASGEKMWKGMSDTAIMAAVMDGEIPSPRSVNPHVSDELEHICMKALAPAMEDRYRTAFDLQSDLEALIVELHTTVNAREIGMFVSSLFADIRLRTQKLVERELSRAQAVSTGVEAEESSTLSKQLVSMVTPTEVTVSQAEVATVKDGRASRFRRASWLSGLSIFGMIAVVASTLVPMRSATPRTAPAPATFSEATRPTPSVAMPPMPSSLAPTPRGMIRLEISAFPAHATLFLDQQRLANNPFLDSMPADAVTHVLRIEAPGYEPQVRNFTCENDITLSIGLKQKLLQKAARSAPQAPAASVQQPKPRRNCNQPFYVDEHGIKRFEVDCM